MNIPDENCPCARVRTLFIQNAVYTGSAVTSQKATLSLSVSIVSAVSVKAIPKYEIN